jgi:hypothetical protein
VSEEVLDEALISSERRHAGAPRPHHAPPIAPGLLTGRQPALGSRSCCDLLLVDDRTATSEDSQNTKRCTALEERLRRMRDLYELGDLHRAECVARRDAINAELSALTPAPIPDLDQAQAVLEDFTIFWQNEADPTARRQFLSLIVENIWLDQDRVIAVQPKPPFLAFFQRDRRPTTGKQRG